MPDGARDTAWPFFTFTISPGGRGTSASAFYGLSGGFGDYLANLRELPHGMPPPVGATASLARSTRAGKRIGSGATARTHRKHLDAI